MELNITEFYNTAGMIDYSVSVAEIGVNAGTDTWQAACEDSPDYMILDNDDKREAFRQYVKGFGAWDDSEIAAWSDVELNALLLQIIAGDVRESCLSDGGSWEEYYAQSEEGQVSGRLFENGEQVYYYIGE
jgi:hypothetical protein